ncbi:hypothetical protein FEM48_Zijuj04G0055700 [Ziziphus jujuba var. spinosa]|uniref:Uncharacterized protein n=1 Tax=Ziziphus jujuba var. spinosa TaxID=714518 RepID=A0A978VI35_ZIZJJ|nr:hypothetical protein FEM48_Zijuj04G0055700 [Ziziphus jujuba var. spinosa]
MIEMLSQLLHLRLVSLVGCYHDDREMGHLIVRSVKKRQISLAEWARNCYLNGTFHEIVDKHLRGKIAPECLNKFVGEAGGVIGSSLISSIPGCSASSSSRYGKKL